MSSEYISGSLETSGSAVVGGGLTVSGNTVLGGRVTVKGFLDAQNIKTPCKGLFKTEEELGEKYPDPLVGWWALVGSSEPLTLYRASGGEWENIGTDTFTIKIECDSLVSQIEAETSAREAADTALQANIDAEAKERKYQDDSLADGIEQTIDTLQSEMDERKAADESLRAELEAYSDNSVDNEAAERKAADTALSERVGALEASMTQSVASVASVAESDLDAKQDKLRDYAESTSSLEGQTLLLGRVNAEPEELAVRTLIAANAAASVEAGEQSGNAGLIVSGSGSGSSVALVQGDYNSFSGQGADMVIDGSQDTGAIILQGSGGVVVNSSTIDIMAASFTGADKTAGSDGRIHLYTNAPDSSTEGLTHNGRKILNAEDIENDLLAQGRTTDGGVSISASKMALSAAQGLVINNKITALETTAGTLQTSIDSEASARAAVDTALQSSIDKKQDKLTAGSNITISSSSVISADLSSCATEAELEAARTGLQASIDSEASARQSADTELQAGIDKKQDKLTAGENVAISPSNVISVDLSAYATETGTAEELAALQSSVEAETEAREAADEALQSDIESETEAREAADEALQASVEAEAEARQSADEALQSSVEAEAEARQKADEALQAGIDTKQDTLEAGPGITIEGNVISAEWSGLDVPLAEAFAQKQDKLTAGDHIEISEDNVISADLSGSATAEQLEAETEAREAADGTLQASVTEADDNLRALVTAMLGAGVTYGGGVVSGQLDQNSLAGMTLGPVNYETGTGFYYNTGEAYGGLYETVEKLYKHVGEIQRWIDQFRLVSAGDVAGWFQGVAIDLGDGQTDTAELVTRGEVTGWFDGTVDDGGLGFTSGDDVAGWFGSKETKSAEQQEEQEGLVLVTGDEVRGWFNQ